MLQCNTCMCPGKREKDDVGDFPKIHFSAAIHVFASVSKSSSCCHFLVFLWYGHFTFPPFSSLSFSAAIVYLCLSLFFLTLSLLSFLPFFGRWHKMTQKGGSQWKIVQLQPNNIISWCFSFLIIISSCFLLVSYHNPC